MPRLPSGLVCAIFFNLKIAKLIYRPRPSFLDFVSQRGHSGSLGKVVGMDTIGMQGPFIVCTRMAIELCDFRNTMQGDSIMLCTRIIPTETDPCTDAMNVSNHANLANLVALVLEDAKATITLMDFKLWITFFTIMCVALLLCALFLLHVVFLPLCPGIPGNNDLQRALSLTIGWRRFGRPRGLQVPIVIGTLLGAIVGAPYPAAFSFSHPHHNA